MSSHEPNCVFPRKRVHRYALCFGIICVTYIPVPPATQYLPEILFFGFSTFTPYAYSGYTLSSEMQLQPVTSQGCFGRAKMTANFDLSRSTSNGEKYTFRDVPAQENYTAFVNKVQTLL